MHVCPECGQTAGGSGFCPRDGARLASGANDPLLGTAIGSYRLARLLGAGGMGRVYMGVQPAIGSRVAIKVLARECAQNRDLVERFFAEARAVNVIRHESIVNILDLTSLPDGVPVIVMEYLDGEPLSAVIARRGALPLGWLGRLVEETLHALAASHEKGIIHRDLKPDNVFVTRHGRPKVLDFGIAKLLPRFGEERATPTHTGALLGTPHYMAPEQARAGAIDERTDLYAAGVILFEGATGRRPFAAESLFDLLRLHVEAPPPAPRALRPELPAAMEAVILRALEKDPARRFGSAREMAEALRQATDGLPGEAWQPVSLGGGGEVVATAPTDRDPPRPSTPEVQAAASGATLPADVRPKHRWGRTAVLAGGLVVAAVLGGLVVAINGEDRHPPVVVAGGDPGAPGAAGAAGAAVPGAPGAPGVTEATLVTVPVIVEVPAGASRPGAPGRASDAARPPAGTPVTAEPTSTSTTAAAIEAPDAGLADWRGVPNTKPLPRMSAARDYAVKGFDPLGYVTKATALAHKMAADAKLIEIDASTVLPSGKVDLTLGDDAEVRFWYRSPARSKSGPSTPRGADGDMYCLIHVILTAQGIEVVNGFSNSSCTDVFRPTPRCSLGDVWQRAVKLGAPTGNVVAHISYLSLDGRWFFDIDGVISETIADDCP